MSEWLAASYCRHQQLSRRPVGSFVGSVCNSLYNATSDWELACLVFVYRSVDTTHALHIYLVHLSSISSSRLIFAHTWVTAGESFHLLARCLVTPPLPSNARRFLSLKPHVQVSDCMIRLSISKSGKKRICGCAICEYYARVKATVRIRITRVWFITIPIMYLKRKRNSCTDRCNMGIVINRIGLKIEG